MISYLPLLLVVIAVPLYTASTVLTNITYSMEKRPSFQSICGRNVLMTVNGYKHKLVSMGNAGGNCFATLRVGLTSKLSCKICVSLEEQNDWIMENGTMNITFTGEAENILLKFPHDNLTETCFEGRRLDILVVEDEEYVRKLANGKDNNYSFKFALKPKCSEEPICESSVPINSSSNNNINTCSNTMDKVSMSFSIINGVILVGLLVVNSYCYYSYKWNQQANTNGDQHDQQQGNGNADELELLDNNPRNDNAGENSGQ